MIAEAGLTKALLPTADRDSESGRERGTGVVLSNHRDEVLQAETDAALLTVRLEKARRRFESGGEPSTRYRFVVLEREEIPVDDHKEW